MSTIDQTYEDLQSAALAWPQCLRCRRRTNELVRGYCRPCYGSLRRSGQLDTLVTKESRKTPCELVAEFLASAENGRDLPGLAAALGMTPMALARRLTRYAARLKTGTTVVQAKYRKSVVSTDSLERKESGR